MSLPIASSSPLPPRYAAWMDELLAGDIPMEVHATCESCAMCSTDSLPSPGGADRQSDARFFDPGVKCCSYLPFLWNFLVGDLLADESPEAAAGRATVEQRLAAGVAVTPLGLDRSPVYNALYRHIAPAFGRTHSMLCPHFLSETGRCGVWRHRESTCSTWFCKHERGAVGKAFWNRLHQLLRTAEESLAFWSLLELDLDPAAISALFPTVRTDDDVPKSREDFDNLPDAGRHRRLWGRWAGRERELYLAAADLVRPLAWRQVAALGGSRLAAQTVLVRDTYRALTSKDIPGRLRARQVQLVPVNAQMCQMTTYSPQDPLRIPLRLAQVLHYFDGRPTSEAIEAIAQDHQLQLTESLLRKLVDYEVLAAVEDTGTATG